MPAMNFFSVPAGFLRFALSFYHPLAIPALFCSYVAFSDACPGSGIVRMD